MRAFPAVFTTAKNATSGQEPVWILKLVAGGVNYYLSDNAFSVGPWAITTKGWIKSWGQLQEGISGTLDEFRISDFSVEVLNDPDAAPNMEALALASPLESSAASLYLWFYGCADPPQEMFRCYVKDVVLPDESRVQLSFQDESLRLERAMIGTKVDLTTYPKADPDDVGKVIPIPFGTVSRLRALAINAGIQTSIPAGINAATLIIKVSSSVGITQGMVLQIDDEQVLVNSISGDTLTCTRGVNSTVAAVHAKGAVVWEYRTDFVYVAADCAVSSIPKVYAKVGNTVLDVSSVCTVWPAGNHPSYPGKAVIAVPGFITVQQAVNLAIYDGITVSNGNLDATLGGNVTKTGSATLSGSVGMTGNVSLSGVVALVGTVGDPGHSHTTGQSTSQNPTTGLPTAYTVTWDQSGIVYGGHSHRVQGTTVTFPAAGARSDATYNLTVTISLAATSSVEFFVCINGSTVVYYFDLGTTSNGRSFSCSFSTGSNNVDTIYVGCNQNGWYNGVSVTACSRTVMQTGLQSSANTSAAASNGSLAASNGSLDAANTLTVSNNTLGVADGIGVSNTLDPGLVGNVLKTGTVSLTGNSVANTMVGDQILCDVVAVNTTITDCFNQVLSLGGYPGTLSVAGSWPGSYTFNGAITEYQSALHWLNTLAFQCRAWFKLSRGVAQLIYRAAVLTPVKTLASCRISGGRKVHSRRTTPYDEILNTIHVLYARDWSQDKSDTAYQAVAAGTDSASVTTYGPRERANLFQFDFVTSPTMAADLLAFYLGWYKDRHWLHEFDTFLYDAELEFGDIVQLGFSSGQIGQTLESRLSPGNSEQSDTIGLVAVV